MNDRVIIKGPLGPFRIPVSVHPRTREVCEQISRQVFDGEYDHPELPGPKGVIRVVDIGAGWGAFTVWARKKWPEAYIEAFEPHAEAADVFNENVHELGRDGLETFLYCAAVTTDPAPRINGCEDWGAYHLAPASDTCARPVAGVHPRMIWECDVLKVDAEGAEVEILENYRHLRKCRALLVEFHSPEKRAGVRAIAEAAGFRLVKDAPPEATFGVMVWVKR